MTSGKTPEKIPVYEHAKKTLQIMESLLKIYTQWQKPKSTEAGVAAFQLSWDAMKSFATCGVAVPVQCPFMSEL